jgi:DNA-binding beta-propeller fold protein YncE
MPMPPDTVLHHIFYNKDLSKAYVTALGKEILHVIDLNKFPWRAVPIPTPGCKVQEDIIFSDDNARWFVTCMGSGNVAVGDARSDKLTGLIDLPGTYPHGIALHEGIDRMIVTNCVAPDLSDVGTTIEIIRVSTGEPLQSIPSSAKGSGGAVEAVFVPHTEPPVAYYNNMMTHTLAAAVWNPATESFDVRELFDFSTVGAAMPLEMYFNKATDRLYVTTADPGMFHIFDISDGPLSPKLLKTLPAAGGAHHVALTPDERLAFVQNSLLNLPGMSDGSITVVDLETQTVVDSIDAFKSQNLNPNSLTLLPRWYHQMGHFNNGPGPS